MNFLPQKPLYFPQFDDDFLIYLEFISTKVPSPIVKVFTDILLPNYYIAAATAALFSS